MENKYPIIHNVDQGSNEWLALRIGKFTGSLFHRLMKGGRREMTSKEIEIAIQNKDKRRTVDTLFGDNAISYIMEVLDEVITQHDFNDFGRTFTSCRATEWGHVNEHAARQEFEEVTGIKTESIGFIQIAEYLGSSPDFLTLDAIGEIKCPFYPANHTANLFLNTPEDLKEAHYDYYVQMQIEMIACEKEKGYFISFDPLKLQKSLRLKILEVPKDEAICNEIMFRYGEAVKMLDNYKKQLYSIINK